MKKTSLRLTAILLSVILCLTFTGCSAGLGDMLLIKRAYDAILTVNSFSFSADAQAKGAYGAEAMELSAQAEGSCIVDPLTASVELELDVGEQGTLSVPVCLVSADGKPELYAGLGIGGATIWVSLDPGVIESMASGGFKEMLQYMKDYPDPLSRGKEEKINGAEAIPLKLTIPGEMLELKDENGKAIDGEQPIEALDITIWLAADSYLPLRLKADLQPIVSYYLCVSEQTAGMPFTVDELPVTVELWDINAVDTIELPSGLAAVRSVASPEAPADPSPAPTPTADPTPAPTPTAEPSPATSTAPSPKV